MRVIYVLGNDGTGKTTLISILAYNLFLRNYNVGILDLTDQGKGYFFRFGACDFFALGDGSTNIPQKLLVNLQDIRNDMIDNPQLCLNALPLMPGLKVCLTAPAAIEEKLAIAQLFLETYQRAFDVFFVEMKPPLHLLRYDDARHDRVLVICDDKKEEWLGNDKKLLEMAQNFPRSVKVILNKQRESLVEAAGFLKKNKLGIDFILPAADEELVNSTVMETCKQLARSRFLKQVVPLIYMIMLD